jgi:glutamate/aspartate transport system substrate-binding protein
VARWLVCALLMCAGSASATALAARIMAQESIPPKWIFDDGATRGVCPDILAAIERLEPRIKFVGFERGRSLPMIESALESGTISAACAMMDTPRRQTFAIRSQVPLYQIRMRLAAVASDTQAVKNLDDLVRLKPLINTARGSAFIVGLKQRGIAVDDSTGDNVVNLRKIIAGHGRYTYMSELSLLHLIRTERLEGKIRILPAVFSEDPMYFWVSRKADPALAPLVDQALRHLKASGELARIYERWAQQK